MAESPAAQTRKTVTVLFCDVTGSTALGEQLDPESLRAVIQSYFAEMRAVIERHGGTIEKFIGDAVMAVFGVPRVHEDDALRAVRAASEMQTALDEANDRFERGYGVRIQARIGVNTGEVIAGDPDEEGSSFVSGDPVNVAARLQQSAEPGDVVIGEATYRLVRAAVIGEPLVPMAAKGKTDPLIAYRLVVVDPGGEMLPRRLDAPIVGRDGELASLQKSLDEVVGSHGSRIVTVLGAAGLGKSRLAHEFLSSASCSDAKVLRGRCLPYGEGITFWPIAEILEEAAGIQSDDSPDDARAKINALLPEEHKELGERLSAVLGAGQGSGSIQETFLAVRRLLEGLAARRPIVVLFDDIQWAEEAFIDLIQYLVTFAAAPILLLCLARPELLETHPDWTQVSPVIRLQPLDPGGSGALVANLLGGEGHILGDVSLAIEHAAEGNPLFVEEMLRMLVDRGVLVRDGGTWTVVGDLAEIGRPETVHAVIAARLDGLDTGERSVLQRASVIGEVFWWNAVADLTEDVAPVEVARRLQALVRKDMIRPDQSTFFSEDAFRFGHLLIRDVAYESLPKKARAHLHERLARWVEERAAQRTAEYAEIIGYHTEKAYRYLTELGPVDDHAKELAAVAAVHLSSAGQRSFDGGDMSAAIALLSRAASLRGEGDPEVLPLLSTLAYALQNNGRFDESADRYAEMGRIATALGDRAAEARAEMGREFLRLVRSAQMTHDEFIDVLDRVQPTFEELGDDVGLAEALRHRAIVDEWAGQTAVAVGRLEKSIEAAKRAGDRRTWSEAWHWMILALTEGSTPADEAIERIERHFEEIGSTSWRQSHRLADLRSMRGDLSAARELIAHAIQRAEEMGMEVDLAGGMLRASAEIAHRAGDLARAERDLHRAVEILRRIDDKGHLASVAPDLALKLLMTPGREDEVLEATKLGEDSSIEDDVDAQVRWRSAKGLALFRLGQEAEGERLVRDAAERGWRTDYFKLRAIPLEALGEILQRSGRPDEAAGAFERALAVYEAKGDVISAMLVRERARAEAPGETGRTSR
jgi:class 3 adenylate cyclase/tetratricopeptide (TPR) repeat protein